MDKMIAGAMASVATTISKWLPFHPFRVRCGSRTAIEQMAAVAFEIERRQGLAER